MKLASTYQLNTLWHCYVSLFSFVSVQVDELQKGAPFRSDAVTDTNVPCAIVNVIRHTLILVQHAYKEYAPNRMQTLRKKSVLLNSSRFPHISHHTREGS